MDERGVGESVCRRRERIQWRGGPVCLHAVSMIKTTSNGRILEVYYKDTNYRADAGVISVTVM